jgi:branched-chain amino acid transport system substrate-binding protein
MKPHCFLGSVSKIGLLLTLLLSSCVVHSPIRVGFVGQLSGRESDLGIAERNGALLAVEEINARQGIAGRRIELIIKDDQGLPEVAQQVDRELVDEGVVAIVGHVTTAQSLAGLAVTKPAGVVMLSPSASSMELSGLDDGFFRACSDNQQDVRMLAAKMLEQGQQSLVIYYDQNNSAYALAYADGVQAAFEAGGGVVLEKVALPADAPDFSALVMLGRSAEPDAMLVIASAVDTALLIQRARLMDWNPAMYVSDWAYSEALVQTGGQAVEGVQLVAAFDMQMDTIALRNFKQRYQQRFGYEPNFGAMQGYESVILLERALQQTGGRAEGLPDALRSLENEVILGDPITMDAYGDVLRPVYWIQVQNGQLVTLGTLTSAGP